MARWTSSLAVLAACASPAAPHTTQPRPVPAPVDSIKPVEAAATVAVASDVPQLRLPKTFVATGYTASLVIDPAQPRFSGHVVIDGTITAPTSVVWLHARGLDFSVVTAPGTPQLTRHGDDLIALRVETPLQPGPWSVTFEYTGALDPTATAGAFVQEVGAARYVYTQLEAIYARRVFPCIDEPDSKVPWQLTLDVPKGNLAVSNTPVVRESDVGTKHRFEFAKTKPLPSYLVAFGVGPFDVVDGGKTKSGVPVRIVTLAGRSSDASFAAQTTASILDRLETWFATPYPYDKLDILTIPLTVGFGAMENAGLVTAVEGIMLFDSPTPSQSQRRRYIGIAAHELAHQWFGDLVTMAWWDDIWLNEGFATWLATKISGEYEPSWQPEQEAFDARHRALAVDRLVTARKIRQPITAVHDIERAFDAISYRKGASVLSMFESYVGPAVFQRGVRDYIKARAYGNATSADLVSALGAAAGSDLAPAFTTFLEQPGAPELDVNLACDKTGARLELAQHRHVVPGSPAAEPQSWQIPVCASYESNGKRTQACTLLASPTGALALPGKGCPRWVMPNLDGRGYYRVRYTLRQAQQLRDVAWDALSAVEQRVAFADIQAGISRSERRLPLALALSFVPKLLARGDRFAVADALIIPHGLDRDVPDGLADKYAYYMRTTFGPGAAKSGLSPAVTDSLDDEAARAALVTAVAWHGRDAELVAKAVELSRNWRDLPAATRSVVLRIAVDADANVAAKIQRDVATEPSRPRRGEMYAALAAQRDRKRYEAALELVLDPALDIRETMSMLWGTSTEATRAIAERFLRVNEGKLFARFPKDATTGLSGAFAGVFTGSCDKGARDNARSYAIAHYGNLPGGVPVIEQAFEAMDQCIATRALLRQDVRAWLGGIRIPRPSKR